MLSKFIYGSTNEPAARKAAELLGKCGVKGVGTRGHFYDKLKSVVIGILLWRLVSIARGALCLCGCLRICARVCVCVSVCLCVCVLLKGALRNPSATIR